MAVCVIDKSINQSFLDYLLLKRRCVHFDEIVVTGCINSCHFETAIRASGENILKRHFRFDECL